MKRGVFNGNTRYSSKCITKCDDFTVYILPSYYPKVVSNMTTDGSQYRWGYKNLFSHWEKFCFWFDSNEDYSSMYDPVCLNYSDIGLLENVIFIFDLQNSRTIQISNRYKQRHMIHIYLLHKFVLQLDNAPLLDMFTSLTRPTLKKLRPIFKTRTSVWPT